MGRKFQSVNNFSFFIRIAINLWHKTFSVIIREQQQDDLVDLFAKVLNDIETIEKVQIRTDYVIVDRNGFDESLNECKCVCVNASSAVQFIYYNYSQTILQFVREFQKNFR